MLDVLDAKTRAHAGNFLVPEQSIGLVREDRTYLFRRTYLDDAVPGPMFKDLAVASGGEVRLGSWLDRLAFRPTGPPTETSQELALLRVHCPWIPGCTTQFEATDSQQTKFELTFKVLGSGLGDSQQFTCTRTLSLSAAGCCRELRATASLRIQSGEIWNRSKRLFSVIRVDVDEILNNEVKYTDLPQDTTADHPCGRLPNLSSLPAGSFGGWNLKGTSSSTTPVEQAVSLGSQTTFDYSIGIPLTLFGLGVNVGFSAEAVFSRSVQIGSKLAGGQDYHYWFRDPVRSPLEVYWCAM